MPQQSINLDNLFSKKIEDHINFFIKIVKGKELYNFVFTSSATECNKMVLLGFDFKAGDAACISRSEHPSLTAPLRICKERGFVIGEFH